MAVYFILTLSLPPRLANDDRTDEEANEKQYVAVLLLL